jgi:hypothetical protein
MGNLRASVSRKNCGAEASYTIKEKLVFEGELWDRGKTRHEGSITKYR